MKKSLLLGLGAVAMAFAAGAGIIASRSAIETKADTNMTVYYTVDTTFTVKMNVKATNNQWYQTTMTKTALKHYNVPIYSVTFDCPTADVWNVDFQLYDGDTFKSEVHAIAGTTLISDFNGKIYHGPDSRWDAYNVDESITTYLAIPSATVGESTLYVNVNRSGDGGDWQKVEMVNTGYHRGSDPIYSGTFTQWYGGIHTLQFLIDAGGSGKENAPFYGSWTTTATYSGQIYLWDSGWVGPYSRVEDMAAWSESFVEEADFCDVGGDALWDTCKDSFDGLDENVQWFFNNAVANSSGDYIQKAAARYDNAIEKGMTPFIDAGTNRLTEPSMAAKIEAFSAPNNNMMVPAFAILIGAAAFGVGCFFLRRRKED